MGIGMETVLLGTTGLRASRMALGLAALGRPGYVNLGHAEDLGHDYDVAAMRTRAHAVLDEAWRQGVRYFDTARSYGRAEEFLASWLRDRQIAPGDVAVGSKWGYTYTARWRVEAEHHEIKDHSRATLVRQWKESLSLLGEQLDLYQVHSATIESGVLDNREVLAELARLKASGVHLGLTLSGPQQAEVLLRAMGITVGGERLFETVQATWNLLERSAGAALRTAHEAGMGVIVKEALANGLLTERNGDPGFAEHRQLLAALARERGVGIDALALAGVLARPWVDVVLSGAVTVEHLRSNLRAASLPWNDDLEERLAGLARGADDYWNVRRGLAWN
jgi:aryl-alcohol dehydrogenase-like predicted oxidoreductase